jgi:DNA-binding transcriptional MerR regulator
MEELRTITQVTRAFGVTTRMLRYYEEIGLLASERIEGYSYRAYGSEACARLKQILFLKKLRIPLRQIAEILGDAAAARAVAIVEENIGKIDEEVYALSTIRDVLARFRALLMATPRAEVLTDASLAALVAPLPIPKTNLKEESDMEELNRASERIERLTDKDVRIVYLPPATMAAYQYEGDEPEWHVNKVVDGFVRETKLPEVKPDVRHYGFNAPNPSDETGAHGYEMWVTIPDDMEVPAPLHKKAFPGGLYAARAIPFGAFEEWDRLFQWVGKSDQYAYRGDWSGTNMFGCLEEHINYINHYMLDNPEPEGMQLDLLIPIKEKGEKA